MMRLILLLLSLSILSCSAEKETIGWYADQSGPELEFALQELERSLAEENFSMLAGGKENSQIIFALDPDHTGIKPEGFSIQREKNTLLVSGCDAAGLMYGGLELAEQISLYGLKGVKELIENPYMELRGAKFNLPLDARSPSYSDASDAAQKNMEVVWDMEFWKEYIDNMARYRYNFISFWSLHPFPSLIQVPDYPDIALQDVHRSTISWEEYYSLGAQGLDAPEILENIEVIKEISIGEKIEFWREVMAYAKSRNVDIYFITWNIFVNGTGGKYGITSAADNSITRDYFQKSVAEMFRTYPDLAGIGLTTGENMKGVSFEEKEDWAYDTYARGILEVAEEMPDRQFTFIHRQHQADPAYIEKKFAPVIEQENVEFIYSFKYAKAHVFSATTQPYHDEFVRNIGDLKTIWTLRNDDAYYFRWGSPAFVREFIQNIPYQVSRGMYYGSDQWIWGREFTSKDDAEPRQLEIIKHWYHWMMWGRLAYNKDLTDQRFIALLQDRFPETDADVLFDAWQEASMVYPVTTGFHWGRVDFMWYIEGCRSRPHIAENATGFHDVNAFISFPVHEKSGNQTIPDYVEKTLAGTETNLRTPMEVSELLHGHADRALSLSSSLDPGENRELKATLHDIQTISYMGKYYAHKIAGSTQVALYRATGDKRYQKTAIEELTQALDFWKQYTKVALEQNLNPIWTNRVGYVDWIKTTEWVEQDIELAKIELAENN